jgi:hypothetical protein
MAKVVITIEDGKLDELLIGADFAPGLTAAQVGGDADLTEAQAAGVAVLSYLTEQGDVQNMTVA